MARILQSEVKRPLADEILFGKLQGGGKVEVDESDDNLAFHYPVVEKPVAPEPAVVES